MTSPRHPLLIYQRQFRGWSLPALLITLGLGALWYFAPNLSAIPDDWRGSVDALLVIGALLAGALFLFTLIAPALAYVQCRPTYFLVSTPLYRLAISYSRIRNVRPSKFLTPHATGLKRELVAPYLGQTAVAVDLNGFPVNEKFLRFWLGWFMFQDETTGLRFITRDWMALSRDLDVKRSQWKTRRMERR